MNFIHKIWSLFWLKKLMWLLSLRFWCWRKIFFKLLCYVAYVNRRYISEEKTVADNKWWSFPHKSQSWYITHKWFTWMLYRKRISMGRLGHITYWESIISYAGELSSKYVNDFTHVFTIEIQTFLFNIELSTTLKVNMCVTLSSITICVNMTDTISYFF